MCCAPFCQIPSVHRSFLLSVRRQSSSRSSCLVCAFFMPLSRRGVSLALLAGTYHMSSMRRICVFRPCSCRCFWINMMRYYFDFLFIPYSYTNFHNIPSYNIIILLFVFILFFIFTFNQPYFTNIILIIIYYLLY